MKKSIWQRLCCLFMTTTLFILTGCSGQRMMMGTGGTSGTYYAFGGVLAQYMKEYTDYSVTAVSTAASKANIQSIGDGDYQIGFTQSDVMSYAWEGSRSFESDGPCHDFRVLGALYAETVQLITMREDIKSVSDLKGKSVSIGAPGSGVYFNAMDVLEGAGLSVDDVQIINIDFNTASAITELATTNGVFLIPIDGELRDNIMSMCPYYAPMQIAGGTYPGQNEPIETITIKATLIVDANIDEECIYKLTAAIFDHTTEIAKENAKGEELSLENATSGITVPFHKGAARYYDEHGINVPTME